MRTNGPPDHSDDPSTQDAFNNPRSGAVTGGAASDQIGPYRLLQLLGERGDGRGVARGAENPHPSYGGVEGD